MLNNKKKNLLTINVSGDRLKNTADKKQIRPKSSVCSYKPPIDKAFTLKKRSKTNITIENSSNNGRNWNASIRPTSATTIMHQSSLPSSYRLGEVPNYLKNMSKTVSQREINLKRQVFEKWKKKVQCGQHELLVSFKDYQETFNKYRPQKEDRKQEELKLICVVLNDAVDILVDKNTEQSTLIRNTSQHHKNNFAKIEPIKAKLQSIHEQCSKLCENLLGHISTLPTEGGDGPAVADRDLLPIATLLENKINSLNDQMHILEEAAKDLADVSIAGPSPDPEVFKLNQDQITELTKELEKYKSELSSKCKERQNQVETLNELKKQLADKDATIASNKVEIKMITMIKNNLETEKNNIEEKCKAIITDQNLTIERKSKEIEQLKKRQNENVTKEIEKQQQYISELERLKDNVVEKSRELNEKYEKVKKELSLREDKIAQINEEMKVEKLSSAAIREDLRDVRAEVRRVLNEKLCVEEEKINLKKTLELNINELKMDLFRMKLENNKLQAENSSMKNILHEKQIMVNKCQRKLDNWKDVESTLDQLKSQIQKIHRCEDEKNSQLQKLKTDLTVAQTEILDRVESNIANERLIRIKNTLITSLRDSKANICDRDQGGSQVERNNQTFITNITNGDVTVKDVLLRLGNEKTEISREEYIIKQLEESNKRYQRHRQEQEEIITRLEQENLELKYLTCGDQNNDNLQNLQNVLRKSATSQLSMYETEKTYEETNVPTRDWFISHRKEKRHLNVKVKRIDSA